MLVNTISAFNQPILDANPQNILTDAIVQRRLCYSRVPQDIRKEGGPYLWWTGPFHEDRGQTADVNSATKLATFLFYCCHHSQTEASQWTENIAKAVESYFQNNHYLVLNTHRIMSALFQDRGPVLDDQTLKSAEEFGMSCSMIGYRFAYQASGN